MASSKAARCLCSSDRREREGEKEGSVKGEGEWEFEGMVRGEGEVKGTVRAERGEGIQRRGGVENEGGRGYSL